jgi:cellulose synthase/poly-beta-1,6-N-acetylglucosamine synthase-like glycosyltransferase
MEILLIILVSVVFYTYIGYGLFLFLLIKFRKKSTIKASNNQHYENVSLIIAAYNEEDIIEEKILNTLKLDYPKDKLDIIFVTDGSTDNTNAIIQKFPQVQLEFLPSREGKIHAVNRLMSKVKNEVTVFSDANVMLNPEAISHLIQHFKFDKTGAVSGEKKVWSDVSDNASAAGEGFYWKYESFLKRMDSNFNTLVGAAGELFAIRTNLYEPVAKNTIIEDFFLTVSIAAKGYQVIYEPQAIAMETASASISEEEKRKVRISSGGIQAIVHFKSLFNIFKFRLLAFQFISHRVLRWTLTPLVIPFIFVLNILLYNQGSIFFDAMMYGQLVFYILAFGGYIMRQQKIRNKIFHIPFYFVFMNVCVYKGWIRYFNNSQSVVWEKSSRVLVKIDTV